MSGFRIRMMPFTYSDKETSIGDRYKLSRRGEAALCLFLSKLQLCENSCREAIHPSKRDSTPMERCSRAGIMSLWGLAVHPKILCSLVFRILPRLLSLPPSLPKKFPEDGHVAPPSTDASLGTLPELPQDILMDIFATLEIPDLVRAGSVCSSWRSAYATLRNLGRYKLSQSPCLFYIAQSDGENIACLYSSMEKRTYKLTLPEPPMHTRFVIGSSHGWLVTVDDRSEMHLVNPITCEQISLPSVTTMEHVTPIFNMFGVVKKYEHTWHTTKNAHFQHMYANIPRKFRCSSIYALGELRNDLHYKAFVFPDILKGSYIVVLIHSPACHLSFARVGDDKWTWLPHQTDYEDCSYKDGLLYAVTSVGEINAFDLNGPVITVNMIMGMTQYAMCDNMYIVLTPWGDLLNIWRTVTDESDHEDQDAEVRHTEEIKIYKVDTMEKKLIESKCLHEHVLFLGHNQSLCLSAEEYPHLKANHVYFTDNNRFWLSEFKNYRRDIGVLNLDTNSREELVSPQLWSNWPAPVWIIPSLEKL